jgi:hypothetical protein
MRPERLRKEIQTTMRNDRSTSPSNGDFCVVEMGLRFYANFMQILCKVAPVGSFRTQCNSVATFQHVENKDQRE